MGQTIFTGIATALITPFTENGVDFDAYGRLIDWQIENGVDALVAAGTSGEGSTLTMDEHKEVIRYTVKRAAGRVPVIAGTGSNCTLDAIELSKSACADGADALLVVTPYYNKATQKGLIAHFTAVADAVDRPILLYNVPSRTGCSIQPTTYAALAEHPNIQGIKEAGGDISQIATTMALCRGKLDLYSGNDDQILPLMALGGKGCISVLSNVMPAESHEITARFFAGDVAGAAALQLDLLPLIHALFSEVNPIPVKAAMAAMGFCADIVRAPLTPMEDEHREVLYRLMHEKGLIL
ncbi:MAG: 4-hydroxy-tetrahydrodipicolinate synthase [Oscillospiraceae bacterium]|nr:4-hydroxy-tetrahydrodipicolinate synthase [Oscillospiraceae bacterium]MBQ3880803.1 4-hydroxy-tetrahydrodipicolinate synthase [Oscillospiraceae bacterium]